MMNGNTHDRMRILRDYLAILAGSALYSASTVLFIFPGRIILGGTSGISVILESFLPFSPGTILSGINLLLILLAFLVLGKNMASRTLVGSVLTTVFIGVFERLFAGVPVLIPNLYLSALAGASLIAVAGGLMFFVDSSSGGTDIIALIIKKYWPINIGRALLVTDVLIVIFGGMLSGAAVLIASFLGLLVKTFGIDFVIAGLNKKKRTAA